MFFDILSRFITNRFLTSYNILELKHLRQILRNNFNVNCRFYNLVCKKTVALKFITYNNVYQVQQFVVDKRYVMVLFGNDVINE